MNFQKKSRNRKERHGKGAVEVLFSHGKLTGLRRGLHPHNAGCAECGFMENIAVGVKRFSNALFRKCHLDVLFDSSPGKPKSAIYLM